MGLLDKLLGRGKKAPGDMAGDASPRDEGMHQEPAGMSEGGMAATDEHTHEEAPEHQTERES